MGLIKFSIALCIVCVCSVLGFGVDPALQTNFFNEFQLGESFDGVSQVHGFHNGSKAFLFQGTSRSIKASPDVAERVLQKLRNKQEFTILVTLKQDRLNSGVILSIHHADQRFLELESSGHRNEIRLHYRTKSQQAHTEVFPYILADNQWHKVSIAVSASHVVLHVDCSKIYERVVETPSMIMPGDTTVWLGQRNNAHGSFKGIMQDVQLLVMPQGFIAQCPDLNRTCPTCNDFHGLVQKIMELQDILAKTSAKLSRAEGKMNSLDQCYCERTCNAKGSVYRAFESWTDGCKNCTCMNGTVQCETLICPPLKCTPDSVPAYVKGACCKQCQPMCIFTGRVYLDEERQAKFTSSGVCLLHECRDRTMRRVTYPSCPELNCAPSQQITLGNSCCKVCKGYDFCADGHSCMDHSECVNLEAGASCSCKDGFRALREDNAYCEDINECAEGRHYCRENTKCVNTPGSFLCICNTGYIRIDDYSCTEHDECVTGQHSCDENALCFNTVGGHNCMCKPGYTGNGTFCKAFCEDGCQNGGTCITPNHCLCPQGFTGRGCETDIDECLDGFVECDSRANCINLPGWYHCECRDGYHDNGMLSPNGESCEDIDECTTGRHSCANDTVCFNLDGGYDCRCPHGKNCTGDCIHESKIKHNGHIWVLENDRCTVCSCQSGLVMCRRMVCDCENPTVDLFCCPECDPRLSSQCLHQSGQMAYSNGDTWVQNCQQCQCLQGEVDCWPLSCPKIECEFTVIPEGECCPRCVSDPCQADTVRNDITKTCTDEHNMVRFTGSSWIKHGTECTICQCKNGHVCCLVDPMCL
ncbi:protein kinase C-binding protein NELL2-like isoform X1 [Polyodon spathula]|uniref:protein kinase C-binding protein NELL2-like isoform X1 n=1 Tax=Polyodon spathula TaxID=7913 RepID=UPI001B7E244D|nr:protein kinase C-binding protein NELL2-like isoform X1 [Polyodon spathula]XP_041113956.1 protein kinase C-binding protein NELL2-like isoform X1 [Polyodon spathula]